MEAAKLGRYFGMGICVLGLLAVRAFESRLFYDPLLIYFKNDYLTGALPPFDSVRLGFSLSLRFWLNGLLSIGLICLLFPSARTLKLALWVYGVFFLTALVAFFVFLHVFPENRFGIFYLRRFLIQPLLLLLFVPALYYQQVNRLKKS